MPPHVVRTKKPKTMRKYSAKKYIGMKLITVYSVYQKLRSLHETRPERAVVRKRNAEDY